MFVDVSGTADSREGWAALRSQAREELTRLETPTCASLRGLRAKRTPLLRVAHVVPGSATNFYLLPFAGDVKAENQRIKI